MISLKPAAILLTDQAKKDYLGRWIVILVLALLSLGAWWGGGETKKNVSNTQNQAEHLSKAGQESMPLSKIGQNADQQPKTEEKKVDEGPSKALPQKKLTLEKNKDADEALKVVSPGTQKEEAEKIQGELKEIINRTQQLQTQVKSNRLEIQSMLERARIHERILRNITLPPPTPTRQQFDTEEMIKREKLRLIAEQAMQTQKQLRIIQQARLLSKTSQVAPNETKTSKPS